MKVIEHHRITTLSLIFLLLCAASFADDALDDNDIKDPALREELLTRIERDQEARFAAINWSAERGVDGIVDEDSLTDDEKADRDSLQAKVSEVDSANVLWLKNIVGEQGWPRYSDVGIDGGDGAWLLVQHADADPSFQRQCLDLMTELPENEVSKANVAYLTDRVYLKEGKKQIYGTQFVVRDDEWVPLDIEDEDNVDARRAAVGMPPLSEYKEMLEAVMRGEEIE
jgi:hypothetical protein